jgi:hypothetical protein
VKALSWILNFILIVAIIAMANYCHCPECPYFKSSTSITAKRDTIFPDTNRIISKEVSLSPIQVKSSEGDSTKIVNVYIDSIVHPELVIYYNDTVHGKILSKKISHRLKVPLLITDSIVITETFEKEVKVPQSGFWLGIQVGGGPAGRYRIAPEFEYISKSGFAYSYNYDFLNKVHSAGFKKRISFKKKPPW